MQAVQRQKLLTETAALVRGVEHPKRLFTDWRKLLDFQIGWLQPGLMNRVSAEIGVDPEEFELILMQAKGQTEPHVHMRGAADFLVLGKDEGFDKPGGGVAQADLEPGVERYDLVPMEHHPGQLFSVPARRIHAFYAGPGETLTALGCVYPRIREGEQFDVVPFVFTGSGHEVVRA